MHGHFWKKQMASYTFCFGMFASPACWSERLLGGATRFFLCRHPDWWNTWRAYWSNQQCLYQHHLERNPLLSLKVATRGHVTRARSGHMLQAQCAAGQKFVPASCWMKFSSFFIFFIFFLFPIYWIFYSTFTRFNRKENLNGEETWRKPRGLY